MAIKKIVPYGDETLRRKSKEVSKISKKIQTLVHDLLETMYAKNGVGLAAPQIGENLRVFVIDVGFLLLMCQQIMNRLTRWCLLILKLLKNRVL